MAAAAPVPMFTLPVPAASLLVEKLRQPPQHKPIDILADSPFISLKDLESHAMQALQRPTRLNLCCGQGYLAEESTFNDFLADVDAVIEERGITV